MVSEEASTPDKPDDVDQMLDDWPERLRNAADEAHLRRVARVTARREAAERRRHGVDLRNAWRQARLDARAQRP